MKTSTKVVGMSVIVFIVMAITAPMAILAATISFTPMIGIINVPNTLVLSANTKSVTYNYTVWNLGGLEALNTISITDDTCSPIMYISGDINNNSKLDLGEYWKYNCTKTLLNTTTNTVMVSGYSDDTYHQVANAQAIATVLVGNGLPPPLIALAKIPDRLFPFSFGGGHVSYKYIVINPGVVPLSNIILTDNTCSPIVGPLGDSNGNNFLDTNEMWTYTCQMNIGVSTRNMANVQGSANGLTAQGYAFANVFVDIPGLPHTGLPPLEKNIQ